jgi:hypothetical protein
VLRAINWRDGIGVGVEEEDRVEGFGLLEA